MEANSGPKHFLCFSMKHLLEVHSIVREFVIFIQINGFLYSMIFWKNWKKEWNFVKTHVVHWLVEVGYIPNFSYVNTFKTQTKISCKIMSCTNCCSLQASPHMMQWKKGGGPNCAIENLEIWVSLSGPNTYTESGRVLKTRLCFVKTHIVHHLLLRPRLYDAVEKGGGPNCAIENLAKCNNPRDLPHNSDLIKCNWDLAMSLQCLKSFQ